MKNAVGLLIVCFISLLTSCSDKLAVETIVKKGIVFNSSTSECYNQDKNPDIYIRFKFPDRQLLTYKEVIDLGLDLEEIKEYVIDQSKNLDIQLVIYGQDEQMPITQIPLNYNKQRGMFENQKDGNTIDEPWDFLVVYRPPSDIRDNLKMAIRVTYDDPETKHKRNVFSDYKQIKFKPCKEILDNCRCPEVVKDKKPVQPTIPDPPKITTPLKPLVSGRRMGGIEVGPGIRNDIIDPSTGKSIPSIIYPTTLLDNEELGDIIKQGNFLFPSCEFTLSSLLDMRSQTYKGPWAKMIRSIYEAIGMEEGKTGNHYYLLVQGSADAGRTCPGQSTTNMNEFERAIYDSPPYFLNKDNIDAPVFASQRQSYSNPVSNRDLPNLRANFIKRRIKKSAEIGNYPVAIINGTVVRRVNPLDRSATIYILQTVEELPIELQNYLQ